jgi:hypothetical protein
MASGLKEFKHIFHLLNRRRSFICLVLPHEYRGAKYITIVWIARDSEGTIRLK